MHRPAPSTRHVYQPLQLVQGDATGQLHQGHLLGLVLGLRLGLGLGLVLVLVLVLG